MASPPSPPTPPNCTDAPPATVTPTVPAGNAAPETATSIVESNAISADWLGGPRRIQGVLGVWVRLKIVFCQLAVDGSVGNTTDRYSFTAAAPGWMEAVGAGAAALSKAPPDGTRVPLAPVNDASQPWHGCCPGGERQPRPDATGPAFPTYRGTATWHDKDGYWRHDTLGISPYSNRSNCASKYRWPLSACK